MRDVMDIAVIHVQSVSLRSIAGAGDQVELAIATAHGVLRLRLINDDRPIRVLDLRQRDRRARKRSPLAAVPWPKR